MALSQGSLGLYIGASTGCTPSLSCLAWDERRTVLVYSQPLAQ